MSTSTQQPPRASLLGLPVEIRLGIYDIIKDFDVGYLVNPMPSKTNSPRLPLRDLAISCRLLAQEILAHRNALPDSERYATIDLTNYTMTLSHAPCRATDLNTLKLVYDFSVIDGSTHPWIDWGFLHHIASFALFWTCKSFSTQGRMQRGRRRARKNTSDECGGFARCLNHHASAFRLA
jgi:hypothetical protein